ncbi:MAG: chromosome segregation protein SMC [Pyrinomonadaceae bacterium]
MFKLQRLEITGFKSFADYTEVVFTGNGITAVVGPNGCGKSNVSDAISWVLGEQRAKSLRGGEMKDVVFAGTKSRKPGGMAEVVLHLVRDDSVFDVDENELEDIDETLSEIDDSAVDMSEIDPQDFEAEQLAVVEANRDAAPLEIRNPQSAISNGNGFHDETVIETESVETVKALAVGSTQPIETRVKTKRHWRPRSFALDFAPGEAVSVTRRLYLSGESEYQLNGKSCRLRDITDLFAGTGLSGAHYAIIEQGRIGQILSAKPADRRSLIEEAAGISKFRARQRAAETRLESAKTNLARIFDIVSEVETRVNSLRRQAAKTRRFKILQEEFRELLHQLYAAEGKHLAELSDEFKKRLAEAEAVETDLAAQVTAKEEGQRESTQAARAAEENLAEVRKIHANNALERDRAEREHLYKSDQIVSLNTRCETLRTEIAAAEERFKLLGGELERLKEEEQHEAAEHAKAEASLRSAEDDHRREADALAAIEISIETLRSDLVQHTAAAERFDEIGRQVGGNLTRLQTRLDSLDRERKHADETFTANQKHADELAEHLAAEEKKLVELNEEKEQLLAATLHARAALRDAEGKLVELQDEHSAKRHRLATLVELEEKRAVYTPPVQKLFAEAENIGVRLAGVLADRLNVTPQAETAVEMLFGPLLEAVIVESLDEARRVTAWLRSNEIGRTALIVLPGGGKAERKEHANSGDTIADHLGVSHEVANVLRQIFPREMSARLVHDFNAPATPSAETGGHPSSGRRGALDGETLVNFDGDLLLGGHLLIGGNRNAEGKNESLLAFKRELHELEGECSRLSSLLEASQNATEMSRASLVDLESKTVDLQSLIIKVDRGIHGLQIQAHAAHEEIQRAERHRKVVADETAQVKNEIADLEGKRSEAGDSRTEAEAARMAATTALTQIAGEVTSARHKTGEASSILNEKRMIAATSDERRRAAASALRRVENEARELESRLAIANLELTESDTKIKTLHNEITAITDRIASAGDEMTRETREVTDAVNALTKSREASDKMSEELGELNRKAAEARNARAETEVAQAEAVTRLENIAEHCQQELNMSLTELVDKTLPAEDFVLENARGQADELRQKLENFGAINMLALEELGEAEERHLFLTSQREDIIQSIAATEEALREIKQRSRERFRNAFEAINENFSQFFQELFGGGQGQMTLMESDDILEAGIEVVAQPPGKRLQNILLLSGGEKAMAAISLVLAIFKYRPSPFCLLDEVDAPLDDANVGRFAAKIAEMSEKTQFIVITHNKRTMEAARALYGVTMQEPGVSKIVSVKFE